MIFNYDICKDKQGNEIACIDFEIRRLDSLSNWQKLRDIVGALKIQIDCNCHVELLPLKESVQKFLVLHPEIEVLRIEIRAETWHIKKSHFKF